MDTAPKQRHPAVLIGLLLLALTLAVGLWLGLSPTGIRLQAQAKSYLNGRSPCTYGVRPSACIPEEVCANVEPDRAECVKRYTGSTPFIPFPFDSEDTLICTQGPQSMGTHSFVNSLFAIDLASPPDEEEPATVYSVLEGTAIVYRSCSNGSPASQVGKLENDDPCGGGFGNHIRVINPQSGLIAMYAHLGNIVIQDGQAVQVGEPLGLEGQSGRAGHRHLHFSLHHAPITNWAESLHFYRDHPGSLPPSIPFETQYCNPSEPENCLRRRSRVEEIPCIQGSEMMSDEQVKGPMLQADWRD